jgi:hypothetical protein
MPLLFFGALQTCVFLWFDFEIKIFASFFLAIIWKAKKKCRAKCFIYVWDNTNAQKKNKKRVGCFFYRVYVFFINQ